MLGNVLGRALLNAALLPGEDVRRVLGHTDYFVTSLGRVLSTKYGKVRELIPDLGNTGAPRVTLSFGNVPDRRLVARMVAHVFLGTRHDRIVMHLDGDSANNRVENLQYGTKTELGLLAAAIPTVVYGERQHSAKLDREKVANIRRLLSAGETHSSIARRFDVSRPTIGMIARGVTWRRV